MKYRVEEIDLQEHELFKTRVHLHHSVLVVVVEGSVAIQIQGVSHILVAGESVCICTGMEYSINNVGKVLSKIVFVRMGEYVGEDDLIFREYQ